MLRSLLVSLPGPDLPDHAARWLEGGLGGVVLFARNVASPEGLRRLCRSIRDIRPDALIALDEEGGEVTRLEASGGSSWPGARVLGVVDDPSLTGRVAAAIAGQLAAAGANVNLAPVADVPTAGGDPVIGNRAFGEDAALVGRHAAAFAAATQGAGVAACAKHAPGHGPAGVDSHLDLPVVDLDAGTLRRHHLAPFAEAVSAGVAMMMTAHVVYPALDDRPATLSPVVIGDLLRGELGFDGVVATDALTMGAIAGHAGVVAGAVAALAAGADLLCVDGDPDLQGRVVAGLDAAVASGELGPARIEEAAGRVDRLAAAFPVPTPPAGGAASGGDHRALGLEAARAALAAGPVPPPLAAAPYVVELTAAATGIGEIQTRVTDAVRRLDAATSGDAFPLDSLPSLDELLRRAGDRPIVLAVRDARRRPAVAGLVAAVLAARPAAVVVGLGSVADAALAPGRFVAARGSAPPNLAAAAEVLLGQAPAASAARRTAPATGGVSSTSTGAGESRRSSPSTTER